MKGKVYLKQQLLNDTITTKRYGKGILVQIKEEKVFKILKNKEFTKETDIRKGGTPQKSLTLSEGQSTVES